MIKQYRAEFRIKDDRARDMTAGEHDLLLNSLADHINEHAEVSTVDGNHGIKSAVITFLTSSDAKACEIITFAAHWLARKWSSDHSGFRLNADGSLVRINV